jgi:hypothetical protein
MFQNDWNQCFLYFFFLKKTERRDEIETDEELFMTIISSNHRSFPQAHWIIHSSDWILKLLTSNKMCLKIFSSRRENRRDTRNMRNFGNFCSKNFFTHMMMMIFCIRIFMCHKSFRFLCGNWNDDNDKVMQEMRERLELCMKSFWVHPRMRLKVHETFCWFDFLCNVENELNLLNKNFRRNLFDFKKRWKMQFSPCKVEEIFYKQKQSQITKHSQIT